MGHLRISTATPEEARDLFDELDADLGERYGVGEPVHLDPTQLAPPRGTVLLAHLWDTTYDDLAGELAGEVVGCAAVRPLSSTVAELKRMWVRPYARRRGVARALVVASEQFAADAGYAELWLETGLAQPEAIALYAAVGYAPVARFGQYARAADARHLGRLLGPA